MKRKHQRNQCNTFSVGPVVSGECRMKARFLPLALYILNILGKNIIGKIREKGSLCLYVTFIHELAELPGTRSYGFSSVDEFRNVEFGYGYGFEKHVKVIIIAFCMQYIDVECIVQ